MDNNTQLNYRIDRKIKDEYDDYCKDNALVTNKTLEKIIKDWLKQKKDPQ